MKQEDKSVVTDDETLEENEQEFINKTIKLYNEKNVFENIRNKAFNLIERDCSIDGFKSILQSNLVELVKTN